MKNCKDCWWFLKSNPFGGRNFVCMHPFVRKFDPVAGAGQYAEDARSKEGVCGPEGSLYSHHELGEPTIPTVQ